MSLYDEFLKERKKKSLYDEFLEEKGLTRSEEKSKLAEQPSNTWFKASKGNILSSTAGTVGDIGINFVKGIANIGEGIGDLITYAKAGISDAKGDKERAEILRQNAQINSVDELFKGTLKLQQGTFATDTVNNTTNVLGKINNAAENNSILGDKSDNIVQGLGYVAGLSAASFLTGGIGGALGASSTAAATVGSTATTFASAMGQGMSEAYQDGANNDDAWKYGVISGIAEAGSEMLFGGLGKATGAIGLSKGITSVDDALAKKVSGIFKSTIAKNLSEYVIKAGAEGTEEVVSGLIQALGQKITYKSEKKLNELIKDQNLLEQFVAGAVTSAIAQIPGQNGIYKTTKNNRDFITGMTSNETKVYNQELSSKIKEQTRNSTIEKMYNEQIKAQENLGVKLTEQDKSMIRNSIEQAYESGRIQDYKLDSKEYAKIEEQIMNDMQEGNISSENIMKALGENQDISKDNLLIRSMYEEQQKSQSYQVQETDNEKVNALLQSATESGLNNTSKTRRKVELISKLVQDTDRQYKFVSPEQLKQMGYNENANGLINKETGEILINSRSDKGIQSIIGHETTHIFDSKNNNGEYNKEYQKLQDYAIEYAKTKGIYDSKVKSITEAYGNLISDESQIREELTADLVGDFLFNDETFIENLAVKDRNIFQKIYDYIKHAYKIVTAKTEEAKQLEKLKYQFDKVYKTVSSEIDTDTKYSIASEKAIKNIKNTEFYNEAVDNLKLAKQLKREGKSNLELVKNTGWYIDQAGDWKFEFKDNNMELRQINFAVDKEYNLSKVLEHDQLFYFYPELAKYKVLFENRKGSAFSQEYKTIYLSADKLNNPVELKGTLIHEIQHAIQNIENTAHGATAKKGLMRYYNTLGEIEAADTKQRYLKDIEGKANTILPETAKRNPTHPKIKDGDILVKIANGVYNFFNGGNKNVYKNKENLGKNSKKNRQMVVDRGRVKYSISDTDNQGRILSKEQQEYFKDSAIRVKEKDGWKNTIDRNGNLFEVYHGTNNDEFNIFDSDYIGSSNDTGWYGKGFYFAFTKGEAKTYGNNVLSAYLNIKNPFNFLNEMGSYDGQTRGDINYDLGAFLINLNEKFPNLSKNIEMKYTGEYDPEYGGFDIEKVNANEVASKIKEVYDSPNLKIVEIDDMGKTKYAHSYADNINDYNIDESLKQKMLDNWILNQNDVRFAKGDLKYYPNLTIEDLNKMEEFFNTHNANFKPNVFGYQANSRAEAESMRLSEATYYVTKEVYRDLERHTPETYMQDISGEFTEELKKMGYDGVIQSDTGDEIVAFYPEQIKRTDNLNPTDNPDIRLSMTDNQITGDDIAVKDLLKQENSVDNSLNQKYNNLESEVGNYGEQQIRSENSGLQEKTNEELATGYTEVYERIKELDRNIKREIAGERRKLNDLVTEQLNQLPITKTKAEKFVRELANNKVMTEEDVNKFLKDNNIFTQKETDEYLQTIRKDILSYNFNLSDSVRADLKYKYGNIPRNIKLNNNGLNVDQIYQELSNKYPDIFSPEIINASDEAAEIIDFMRDVNPTSTYEMEILNEEELSEATTLIYAYKQAYDEAKNYYVQYYLDEKNKIKAESLAPQNIIEEDTPKKLTRKMVRDQIIQKMGITADELANGNDISSINFQLTDPIRVNEKVFGRELGKKINQLTIEQTKHNTAEKTRWLNKERAEIESLGIKARSKESAAVQKYGEKQYVDKNGDTQVYGDEQLAKEFKDVKTQEKIKYAAEEIRKKYDTYIDQINSVLTALGYNEIPKRKDYMRHFQELGDVFSQTGVPFNLNDMKAEDLPTDINGLTEFNKPGKNWFAQAQKRYGNKTTYDAITGIDGYLEGAGNLIFHTQDIQNYRALTELIRDTFGASKGFQNLEGLSDEQALKRIEDIQSNKLSKYVAWLDEQANSLAGKKGAIDRGVERALGRRVYTFFNTIKTQVGSNMTGFNIRSSLTNFISSTIAASKTNKIAMVKGTVATINNMFHNDGFIDKSDFLTARFGSEALSQKLWQKVSNAGQIFMSGSDYFTSNLITRSKYYEGLQKGMNESEAIKYADDFAARVMGDRSQGSTAEAFNSKTLGLFTQFQLETNNQWQYMIHDTKMDYQENSKINTGLKAGATALFQMGQLAAYSYFFNELFEKITGSRAAFDPIEIFKTIFGLDDDDDKELDERISEAGAMLVDNIPFGNLITGGGRIPISEAFTGVSTLGKKLTGQTNNFGNEITWEDVGEDTLKALPYWILPTGYSQGKKTIQGLDMFSDDKPVAGSYTDSGNLRYTVDDTIGSKVQAALFGKSANPYAQDYANSGFKTIQADDIQEMVDLGMNSTEYRKYKKGLSNAGTKTEEKLNYIQDSDLTPEQKNVAANNLNIGNRIINMEDYSGFNSYGEYKYASDNPGKYTVISQIDTFDNYNVYKEEISDIKEKYSTANGYTSEQRKSQVTNYINKLNLNMYQKMMLEKMAGGYSIKNYRSSIQDYLDTSNLNSNEKYLIWEELFD